MHDQSFLVYAADINDIRSRSLWRVLSDSDLAVLEKFDPAQSALPRALHQNETKVVPS